MTTISEQKVPEFVDKARLCFETSLGATTVDRNVELGKLPPPVKIGGKLLWEWAEVRDWIKKCGNPATRQVSLEDRIREQSRQAMQGGRQ